MGLLDKSKGLAEKAKQAVDDKVNRASEANIERENEGLSPEEIIAKDEAKKIITFSRLEIAAYSNTGNKDYYGKVSKVGTRETKIGSSGNTYTVLYQDQPCLRCKFKNESERRMKYLSMEIDGLNAVGDIVKTEGFKSTGPFEPGKTEKTQWNRAFGSAVVEMKLKKITIEYFDGEEIVLDAKWIDRLINESTAAGVMSFLKA